MLAGLLKVGDAFLAGGSSQADVLATADQLHGVWARFQEGAPKDGAEADGMAMTLQLLGEAEASVRSLAVTRDRRALQAAESLLTQAADLLEEMRNR